MAERRGLTGFHDLHSGAAIVVCGCGASLNDLVQPERFVTIGVNDIGRKFHPNYLVVLNPREQFTGDRFRYVESSQAQYIFTQLDLSLSHPGVVRFRLGQYGGTDLSDPEVLPYTQNSPYVALCLAAQMGARRIGLIGVDFTEHHFFAATGTHQLSPQLATIDEQYRRLGAALRARGIEVYNLSQQSLLTAFPKMTLEEFAMNTAPAVSQTAPRVFGVDYRFLACGEVFGTGLRHAAADLGLAYDGALWDDPALPQKIDRFQPDLILVVHGRRFAQTWGETFRRYHTAVWLTDEPYEVDDTATWSGLFQTVFVNDPNTRARHRNAHYLPVCFDPHVQRDLALPRDYGAGFIGGYNNVREEYLKGLAEAGLLAYVVGGPWRSAALQRLSLGDNVAPARTAELYQQTRIVLNVFRAVHHFNRERVAARSLNPRIYEALACGALVVSEERAELAEVFPELPTFHDPQRLTDLIERLLADEPHRLSLLEQSRARLVGHSYADRLARVLQVCLGYDSARAVVAPHQMLPPDAAATRAPVALPFANPQSVNANPPAKVSVIIPHGGQERAPQLIATLANLHRCHGVAEIIVVEMGVAPTAENIVRQGGDKYVFVHHEGAFERARALNIGTPFATSDLLLWMDNDLLLPVEFLLHAVQELHERRLDFLVPWTAVHYLSEADTAQVLQGLRQPAACAPSNTFYSQRGTSGGAGLVRKSFVLQYGGLSEGFRGWGGEDDAWFYKAHLLGAAAATERQDQILFHLFHTDSADPVRNRIARNPHYADNLALLTAMRSIRQREIFLQRFPPPATFSCPWPVSCRIALVGHSEDVTVGGKAEQVGQMLKALYGTVLERFVVEENGSFPELIQAGARQLPEAILVFGSAVARQLLANACLEPVWKQIIVIHDSDVPSDSASLDIMARAGAHLATAKASGDLLQQAGLQPWPHAVCDDDHDAARHLALGLAQPLSVLLGRAAAGPMFETTKGDAMKAPEYSILMVTHNGLEMIRMSTLRTLRHIAGQDARLIVVDNASTDGSLEWLEMLARRGDIELIRNATNIGHGPALELAWHKTRSPYIVTLDSDAFPLSDDWLPRLRARLEGNVKVAGIRHHRDYVHPSCLMIARQTLEEFNLSFLERAHQPLRHDVGEAISYEIKQRGYEIAGLELSDCQRRGSTAEPIYLGSEYEGIVYH